MSVIKLMHGVSRHSLFWLVEGGDITAAASDRLGGVMLLALLESSLYIVRSGLRVLGHMFFSGLLAF